MDGFLMVALLLGEFHASKKTLIIEYWRGQVKNRTIAFLEQKEYNKRFTNKKYLPCGK